MENIFKKFFTKSWFVYRKPEIVQLILEQIHEDATTYKRRSASLECERMNLQTNIGGIKRSNSAPALYCKKDAM
jgi:hypothetical protein